MDADLNRAASVRTRELADQDVLRPLDAARELGPGGLQAGDVPLHSLRYSGGVHRVPPVGPGSGVLLHLRGHFFIRHHHSNITVPLLQQLWYNSVHMNESGKEQKWLQLAR